MRFHRPTDEAGCREMSRTLQAYLDGHVDEVTARRVARHLEACRRCGLEAEVYTRIKELSGVWTATRRRYQSPVFVTSPNGWSRRGLLAPASHRCDAREPVAGYTS